MADRRLVAQSIVNSSQVSQLVRRCGPWAGLFFTWCLTFVDDDSRLDGDPEALRFRVLGRLGDLVSADQVRECVASMNDLDLAVWYEVTDSPGERFLYFPKFYLYQQQRPDRYVPSRLPAPPAWDPEPGHPYAKDPDVRQKRPQRDKRRTRRVPKRRDPQLALLEEPFAAGTQTDRGQVADESRRDVSEPTATPPTTRGTACGTSHLISSHLISSHRTAPRTGGAGADAVSAVAEDALDRRHDAALAARDPVAYGRAVGERKREHQDADVAAMLQAAEAPWRDALGELAVGLPKTNFGTWFKGTELVLGPDGEAIVYAPNGFARDWLRDRYGGQIRAAIQRFVAHRITGLRIEVEEVGRGKGYGSSQ